MTISIQILLSRLNCFLCSKNFYMLWFFRPSVLIFFPLDTESSNKCTKVRIQKPINSQLFSFKVWLLYHYSVICAKIYLARITNYYFYSRKVSFLFLRARIPVASQVTALEIWLLACILLVFGALAEYAFILRQVIKLSRQQQRMRNHFNLQLKNSDGNNTQSPPQQLDVFSPNAGKVQEMIG